MRIRRDQKALRIEELRARRAMVAMSGGRTPRRRRPPKQNMPRGAELQYRTELLKLLGEIETQVEESILPIVRRAVDQTRQRRPDAAGARFDAPADDVTSATDRIRERLASTLLSPESLRASAGAIAQNISVFNRGQLNRVFEATVGIGLPSTEPGLTDLLRGFIQDNARLITSLATDTISQIEGSVLRGLRRGQTNSDIAASIRNATGVSARRARLIARDQVASLNGELTQIRQTRMGVSEYIWRTSGDERVRDEHQALDGTRHSWANPPAGGHPGEPINCRCVAEPVLDDIFAGL